MRCSVNPYKRRSVPWFALFWWVRYEETSVCVYGDWGRVSFCKNEESSPHTSCLLFISNSFDGLRNWTKRIQQERSKHWRRIWLLCSSSAIQRLAVTDIAVVGDHAILFSWHNLINECLGQKNISVVTQSLYSFERLFLVSKNQNLTLWLPFRNCWEYATDLETIEGSVSWRRCKCKKT